MYKIQKNDLTRKLQAIWPFAKQVCEDADMQLLWFEDDMEQDELRNLLISFRETLGFVINY